jgi:hypothetical protein
MPQLDQIFQAGPIIAMERDPEEPWQILSVSGNTERFGLSFPPGTFDLASFIDESDFEIISRKLGAGIMQRRETILMRYRFLGSGTRFWVEESCSLTYHNSGNLAGANSLFWITTLPLEWHILSKGAEAWNSLNAKLRHDMLNQLTAILGYLELSEDLVADPMLKDFCQKEQQAAEKIREKLILTREYQKIGLTEGSWVTLASLIAELCSEAGCNYLQLVINVPDLKIFADSALKLAIVKIIENVPEHAPEATLLRFGFTSSDTGGILSIEDNGKGIPETQKTRIFDLGFGKNGGNGLFLSEKLLNIYGISLRETGAEGTSARFDLTIPFEILKSA